MNKKNELTANQALKLAVEAADSGDKKKAEKYFNAVLKSYPDNQDAINGIKALNPNNLYRSELDELKGLLKQGKFKEVVIRGNMLLERYTDVFELYHYVAVAMGSDGKHAEALPYFKRAAELNPHDVNAQFNLGNAFRTFGDHKKAIESYKRVLKIDHAFAPAYNNAGNTFMDMKDYFNAIEAFDSASRLYPKSFEMQNNMALALKASGDYKQAIIYFKKVAVQRIGVKVSH